MRTHQIDTLWRRGVARVRSFVADASISRKLLLFAMVPTLTSLLLASLLLFGFTATFLRQWTYSEIDGMARMVAKQLSACHQVGQDRQGGWTNTWNASRAEATLHLLDHSRIEAAALYDENGRLLANSFRDKLPLPLPPAPPSQGNRHISDGILHYFHPIEALTNPDTGEYKVIGTLYLRADTNFARGKVALFAFAAVLIVALCTLFSYLLAGRLQRIISMPITHLSLLTRLISEERDFSLRAVKHNNDEIGQLVDEFNMMLDRIEEQRHALQEAHDSLEMRVQARTEELQRETLEHKQTAVDLQREIRVRKAAERELKAAKALAEAASHAKGEFVAQVSHELRTPLSGILGMAELMQATPLLSPQRRYLEAIRRSGNSLLKIIGDVLDYSKIEAGQLELAEAPFNLHSVCEDVVELLSPQAFEKGVALFLRYDPAAPRHLVGDATRVSQIVTNLAANALKFTDAGHVLIDVSALPTEGDRRKLRIFVEDTGIGASKEKLHRIFERYVQGDKSIQKSHGGTGLGLSIARSLAELMDGTIGVQSREGVGSRFIVTLALPEDKVPDTLLSRNALTGRKAVVLDANGARAAGTRRVLESWGMTATHVRSLEEAAGVLRADATDAVLIESQGLDVDPDQCLIVLRDAHCSCKYILVRPRPALGRAPQKPAAGYAGCLSHPVREMELRFTLERVLVQASGDTAAFWPDIEELDDRASAAADTFWSDASVLVVDDSEVNREVAVQMLRGFGCSVSAVEDGSDALRLFEQGRRFDLVLMDCQMEHMDGYEAARRIRDLEEEGAHVPIVAVTAMALVGEAERCIASGMDDYLLKPFNPAKLMEHLRRWIPSERRGYRSERRAAMPETDLENLHANAGDARNGRAPLVLDLDKALWVTGGNRQLFHRASKIFMRHMPERFQSLNDSVGHESMEDIQRLAHSIKGASASVGGEQLRAVALALELAARDGNREDIGALYVQLRAAYDLLEAALLAELPAEQVTETEKP